MLAVAALTLAIACTGGDEPADADATAAPSPPAAAPDTPVTTTPPPAGATDTPAPTPDAPGAGLPLPPGTVEELAPIVSVELAIAESFPPQYFASIVSAQPNGCTHFSRFELERSGSLLEITVYNTVPENLAVVLCTAIYGETVSNVVLGIDFEPGETYTLRVNGAEQRFVAQ